MGKFHYYGLICFSKKTGKIDMTMTSPGPVGKERLQLWASQNANETQACVVVDIDEHKTVAEYIGTTDGFLEVRECPEEFEFNIPDKLYAFPQTRLPKDWQVPLPEPPKERDT